MWKSGRKLRGKHILISGGSTGIGLCFAIEVIKLGANVTIFARCVKKLEAAQDLLQSYTTNTEIGRIKTISVDVAGPRKFLNEAVETSEDEFGPIFMLVNCAGYSEGVAFDDLTEEALKVMMDVNFVGSFLLTQEVVRSMKRRDNGGHIIFVSSQAGLFGMFGYTGYSASKGAVIKLAEALHMEMKPWNIAVTVGLPPETNTPGYAEQNKDNPIETALISESAGLFQPDVVAKTLLEDALDGKFYSTNGLEGFLLTTLCAGMSPVTSLITLVKEILLLGPCRLIATFYLRNFASIVQTEHKEKKK